MTGWARVHMVLHMAMAPEGAFPMAGPAGPAITDRARSTLNRMSRNIDVDVYEAMSAMVEAMQQLEREVHLLRHRQALSAMGVELRGELVEIGGDGVTLQRDIPFGEGDGVQVHLDLKVWGMQRLMVLRAVVRKDETGSHLDFTDIGPEQRDTLVALVFQEQGRRRRHALADADG